MRKSVSSIFAVAATLVVAGAAVAAPPFKQATGGIALSSPSQYVSFNAFDYGATGDRGTIAYTNFDYAGPGSGVWDVEGIYNLNTSLNGGVYGHEMNIDSVTPISTTASKFSGTGRYLGSACTWTVKGLVSGSDISYVITYNSDCAAYTYPYTFSAVGTIAADGSMSGTGTDSLGQAPLTWAVPAGSVDEVFSYTASVTCAEIGGANATFGFTIPPGVPLAGIPIVVKVKDGGTPGTNGDTYAHGQATTVGSCQGSVNGYPIVGGNLVVH